MGSGKENTCSRRQNYGQLALKIASPWPFWKVCWSASTEKQEDGLLSEGKQQQKMVLKALQLAKYR